LNFVGSIFETIKSTIRFLRIYHIALVQGVVISTHSSVDLCHTCYLQVSGKSYPRIAPVHEHYSTLCWGMLAVQEDKRTTEDNSFTFRVKSKTDPSCAKARTAVGVFRVLVRFCIRGWNGCEMFGFRMNLNFHLFLCLPRCHAACSTGGEVLCIARESLIHNR